MISFLLIVIGAVFLIKGAQLGHRWFRDDFAERASHDVQNPFTYPVIIFVETAFIGFAQEDFIFNMPFDQVLPLFRRGQILGDAFALLDQGIYGLGGHFDGFAIR